MPLVRTIEREYDRTLIRCRDLELPRAAIAQLAARLHSGGQISLSYQLGHAIDHHLDELALKPHDYEAILIELRRSPMPALEILRQSLEGQRGAEEVLAQEPA